MSISERSYLGFAKQTAVGTPVTTNASFDYLLFTEAQLGPNNQILPLDPEVGGGALLRNIVKTGIVASGTMTFIPRPRTIGHMLMGMTGYTTFEDERILPRTALTTSTQNINTGLPTPPAPTKIQVFTTRGGNTSGNLNVVINGTNFNNQADTETINAASPGVTVGTKVFRTITSITLPARLDEGDAIAIGMAFGGARTHVFRLGADQFQAPYYTVRFAPGGVWGERYQDCRFTQLQLNFRAADFVRGQIGFLGGRPYVVPDTGASGSEALDQWAPQSRVDGRPPFIATVSTINGGDLGTLTVRAGVFTATSNIPLEEQWIVGSYYPYAFDIISRAFAFNLTVYADSKVLYSRLQYDPNAGQEWVASIFRTGRFAFTMMSDELVNGAPRYVMQLQANQQDQASGNGNVVWSATPLAVVAQRKITMAVNGVLVASPDGSSPVNIYLTNDVTTAY